ncbi:DUF5666 domain-containing protein [Helicobacter brantae]|uniref:DUF5666 domain-containing protein n=1 Tax=Helicobacter brantae TaxID=375927 RepID=A0A3D8IZS0_9HELI|nr:DUF5666 domain-containing protein [Helicobacter brantae]RDU70767.1 hypothetical protein CQA58_04375 [Helicobacter brantae]
MKKLLIGAMLVGASLYASDIKGVIQSINNAKKTITVNGSTIAVMPYTKIEQESCGMGWDSDKKFADLKKGDLVEVDLMNGGQGLVAESIDIQCMKNRAY